MLFPVFNFIVMFLSGYYRKAASSPHGCGAALSIIHEKTLFRESLVIDNSLHTVIQI